jgi:integrase
MGSGKVIWYYQTYDEDGRRTVPHSTGETTRTAAVKKCNGLMKDGRLLPKQQIRIPTFGEYAQGWWAPETCLYLKKRLARKSLTGDYELQSRRMMNMFLVPYFGKTRIDRITDEDIDTWLVNFVDREKRRQVKKIAVDTDTALAPKKLKTSYANTVFGILRLMLKQAVKRHIIPYNPADNVEKLTTEQKQVEILTVAEFQELAKRRPKALPPPPDVSAEFDKKGLSMELARMANFLVAGTGMRIGEVLGLRGEFVFADFIRVQGQFGKSGYGPTKTRTIRNIPLNRAIMDGLRRLVDLNGNGYLFSTDGGVKPITRYYFNKFLAQALEGIGIDHDEKKKRNLTPHAWRYFLNTNLRARGVADAKVQSITGHKSQSSTERYTRFYTEEFTEVRNIQDALLLDDGRSMGTGGDRDERPKPKVKPRRNAGQREPGGKRRRATGHGKRQNI